MKLNRRQAEEVLPRVGVQAFLRVIREGESSQDTTAYWWLYGSTKAAPKLADTLADHPRVKTFEQYDGQFIKNGKIDYTTAAGAYQITATTWDTVVQPALKLPDFTPESQDLAAVYLLKYRKALDDVMAGRFAAACAKLTSEWASMPGASHGDQPSVAMAHALAVYAQYGGTTPPKPDSTPPTLASSQAIPAGEASAPEQTMSFADVINNPATKVLLGLINPVLAAVPEVAKIFMDKDGTTVPERNVAAVVKIADVATKALADAGKPAGNMQQVVETLASDPEAKQIVRAAVIDQCMYLVEAGGGGIEGARKADLAISGGDIKHSPSFWVTMALLPLVYMIVGSVVGWWGKEWPSDVRAAIATAIVSLIVGGAAGYYWGQTTSRNRTPAP